MKKQNLIDYIKRYKISDDASVIWRKNENEELVVHFLALAPSDCRGVVTMKCQELEFEQVGIGQTNNLIKILSTMDDDVELKMTRESILISDSGSDANFVLNDVSVINDIANTRPIKPLPFTNVEFSVDKDLVNRLVKGKSALDTKTIGITSDSENLTFVLNYSKNNENNIKLVCGAAVSIQIDNTVIFNLETIVNVLNANKDFTSCTGTITVLEKSSLLKLTFLGDDWSSVYLLPSMNN